MNIVIIGTGYVGLPVGIGFAELGNKVVCVDVDEIKINNLRNGKLTIYENGLKELLVKNLSKNNICFDISYDSIKNADIVIVAVGTPQSDIDNSVDLNFIYSSIKEIAKKLDNSYKVIAIKSTVPIGTCDKIESLLNNENIDVISLPEFLREGYALEDFFSPDRIVVGSNSKKANDLIMELYSSFNKDKLLFVDRKSAELIKYASNSFLAMKIHFINEMANLCEKANLNIDDISKGIGLDSRIGAKFLNPGPGYGGSCFPKDTLALQTIAKNYGVNLSLLNATIDGNNRRFIDIANNVCNFVKHIKSPTLAIYGLSFKKGTDDCRYSPSINIILNILKACDLIVKVYDPLAIDNAKKILGDKVLYFNDKYSCLKDSDLLVILTEWEEFKYLDFDILYNNMKGRTIYDCRNILCTTDSRFNIFKVGSGSFS